MAWKGMHNMRWASMRDIADDFVHSITSNHVYQFEVSKTLRGNRVELPSFIHYMPYTSHAVVALYANSALSASIDLIEMGYTPVKLLTPQEHD